MVAADNLKQFYNTVLSQIISDCGQFLYAGNNYGEIFVFNIANICSTDPTSPHNAADPSAAATVANHRPSQIFKSPQHSAIHSLAFHAEHLLIGTLATVSAHRICPTSGTISPAAAWELKLSPAAVATARTTNEPAEVNSMWLDVGHAQLYAGCGDNTLYAIDVAAAGGARQVRTFTGHTDYVHSVTGSAAQQQRIFSGSEDGTVRFWDAREKRCSGSLEPHREQRLARTELGRWIGCVAVNDADWLVCGGGPSLALWHLRSLECTTVYGAFGGGLHVTGFVDDVVLAGGGECGAVVHEYSLNGDLVAEVPVSGPSVYSAVWHQRGMLALGGASNRLDVCTNLRYRDLALDLYQPVEAK